MVILESDVRMSDEESAEDSVQGRVDGSGSERSKCHWNQCNRDNSDLGISIVLLRKSEPAAYGCGYYLSKAQW